MLFFLSVLTVGPVFGILIFTRLGTRTLFFFWGGGILLVKENTSIAMTNFPFSVLVFVDVAGLTSDDNFRSDIPLLTVYNYSLLNYTNVSGI